MKSSSVFWFLASVFALSMADSCKSRSARERDRREQLRQQAAAPVPAKPAPPSPAPTEAPRDERPGDVTVPMSEQNGVYYVPIEVNGVRMRFIFDTGASQISISEAEALFLYKQGSLTDEDILGKVRFSDANGDISEGTEINLREVKIGDRVLTNVRASVVEGIRAPLLLGQSALARFGQVSIDYEKQTLTLR